MGLTNQYLKYGECGIFNVIAGSKANINFLSYRGINGKYCVVGACEHLFIWDTKKGEKVSIYIYT